MPKHRKFIQNKKNAVTYQVVNCNTESSYNEDAPKTIWIPKSENAAAGFPVPSFSVSKPSERTFPTKGPRPDWDPDVIAALDDDFDYSNPSNVLDDDFISKANALQISDQKEKSDEEEDSDVGSDDLFSNEDEVTKSLFEKAIAVEKKKGSATQYSMTSAVSNCSESVKTFNERFEKILELYEDDEIGALDGEDINGHFPDENELLEELCREKPEEEVALGSYEENLKKIILNYIEKEPREKYVNMVTKGKVQYDCESILSTNSNIYNHPEVIKAETKKKKSKSSQKTSIMNLMHEGIKQKSESDEHEGQESSDEQNDSDDDELNERCSAVCSIRQKDETSEERRTRKKLLKAARREQRMLKKETKLSFKNAEKKISQENINLQKTSGVKLL